MRESELLSAIHDPACSKERQALALQELLAVHYDWLQRMCHFELRGDPYVEDCLQEVLIEIARGIARFNGRSELRTWMFVIARRVLYRARKRLQVEWQRKEEIDFGAVETGTEKGLGGDEQLLRKELNAEVLAVVAKLPEKQRLSVLLHYFEDLSVADGAKQLNCSLGTFKTHLHRARHTLAEELGKRGITSAILLKE